MADAHEGRTLITGGCGFIGSHFVEHYLRAHPGRSVVNLDLLTYAGNAQNVASVAGDPRYLFVRGDVCDREEVLRAMAGCDTVVHFAAESHVDRSLLNAAPFVRTNVEGTAVMLAAAREVGVARFLHMSTDEVYGDIPPPHVSTEADPLRPRSPYAAAKAGAELQCNAFVDSYALPVIIARCSNTYGPRQFPEKLVPLFVTNALSGRRLPVYGDGRQQRDWTHVSDLCRALDMLLERGEPGQVYNVTAANVRHNIDVIHQLLTTLGLDDSLLDHVADRAGHDRRYAMDAARMRRLGWEPTQPWETAFPETVRWYARHADWWQRARDAEFDRYYAEQYAGRTAV